MSPFISIPNLHQEYCTWMSELQFFEFEIKMFERRLQRLVNSSSSATVVVRVEQFQNRFICQKEVLDILKHDLHASERKLAAYVIEVSGLGLHSIRMDNHTTLRSRVQTFKNLFLELKNDFRRFEAKCLFRSSEAVASYDLNHLPL